MTDDSAICILPFPSRPAGAAPRPAALPKGDNLRPVTPALLERTAAVLDRAVTTLDPAALAPMASARMACDPVALVTRAAPTLNATLSGASPVMRRGGTEADGTNDGPATDRVALSRRIVSLHLSDFAMARWLRWATARQDAPPDDLPVVMAVEGPHGPVVSATNRAGTLAGLHVGARVVDMRALCPQIRVVRADPDGDAEALDKLALWARRWCPWTAVDGADGIVMDTTGSDHLWGGEPALLREIEGTLGALGFSVRLAMAPTAKAAD